MATKAELLLGQIVRCAHASATSQEFDQAYRALVIAAEQHAETTNAPWGRYPQDLQLGNSDTEPLVVRWVSGANQSVIFHLKMEEGTVTFLWDRWSLGLTFNDPSRDHSFCFSFQDHLAEPTAYDPVKDTTLVGWLHFLDKGAEMHPVIKRIFEYANVT